MKGVSAAYKVRSYWVVKTYQPETYLQFRTKHEAQTFVQQATRYVTQAVPSAC